MSPTVINNLDSSYEDLPEQALKERVDLSRLPRHIAVIMDGNGRWANMRNMGRVSGHRQGVESVREIVRASGEIGIEVLTLYAFSMENWKRPKTEISVLMRLLGQYLRDEVEELKSNNVRFDVIGRINDLPKFVRERALRLKEATAGCTGMWLLLALSYSSREEITQAARRLAQDAKEGRIDPENIVDEDLTTRLYTAPWVEPDLLIRTSGEMRISNFLLWQIAYAEIHVTPVLWPDFRRRHLYLALLDFQNRERRFGGAVDKVHQDQPSTPFNSL